MPDNQTEVSKPRDLLTKLRDECLAADFAGGALLGRILAARIEEVMSLPCHGIWFEGSSEVEHDESCVAAPAFAADGDGAFPKREA